MSEDQNQPDVPGDDQEAESVAEGSVVVTVDDHEYVVEQAARDDFELLDDLAELSRTGNPSHTPSILRRLLGHAQARVALERLRDPETGRVTVDAGSEFVYKLLAGLNPN